MSGGVVICRVLYRFYSLFFCFLVLLVFFGLVLVFWGFIGGE